MVAFFAVPLESYRDMLAPLAKKRIVFIFDECHRSQFGENHKAIKEFFPKAQLFGFTGTPIFEKNSKQKRITGEEQSLRTTKDLFQEQLHKYTITNAIDDENVLRFNIDYFKFPDETPVKPGESLAKQKVIDAILEKHDTATGNRKFNAILATSSINDAIRYVELFKEAQNDRRQSDPAFRPLSVAAVFSPPAKALADDPNNPDPDGVRDVRQIQEDLLTENADNQVDPEAKKKALEAIIADYNARYRLKQQKGDTPAFHHVSALIELDRVARENTIET